MNKFIVGVCSVVELGCLIGLAGIAFKRNNDCYKAECELISEQTKHIHTEIECMEKDYEIKALKKELEKLKSQNVGEA